MPTAVALVLSSLWTLHFAPSATAQETKPALHGDSLLVESAAASSLVGTVRAGAPGTAVEVFVREGEKVVKGQILGHLELEATKLQLDLARQALEDDTRLRSARSQSEAWAITRDETEEAVRKRDTEKSRLEWAIAMEEMYRANYETQLEAKKVQQIHYDYWKDQYEKRFFRAPADGVVTEVKVQPSNPVAVAQHVFTVSDGDSYEVPVIVPAALADKAVAEKTLPVRTAEGSPTIRARVHGVRDNPRLGGSKILSLLVRATDLPAAMRDRLQGMKFDVLLPLAANAGP